jgi:hypothetical protein
VECAGAGSLITADEQVKTRPSDGVGQTRVGCIYSITVLTWDSLFSETLGMIDRQNVGSTQGAILSSFSL